MFIMHKKIKKNIKMNKLPIPLFLLFWLTFFCNDALSALEGFFSVYGNKIVDSNNNVIQLKGVQFDFGSIRGDIPEQFDNNKIVNAISDSMLDYEITEDDFKIIKNMSANSIRLSLNTYKDFISNGIDYREENFKCLDRVIMWAEKYDISVIISMRQSPGGHNTSPHSGNNGKNQLWINPVNQKLLLSFWGKIASRYAEKSIIIGYDLLNEPDAPDKEVLNQIYRDLINVIRFVDKNHIIFLEGNGMSKDIDQIDIPADNNVSLSLHFYTPGKYTVKGEGTYPATINGRSFNKSALRNELKKQISYAKQVNKPLWIGEFGAMTRAGNYLEYDQDLIDLFNEQELSWTYWNYKNLKGFADTQSIYYMGNNNKFKIFILSIQQNKKELSALSAQEIENIAKSVSTADFREKTELKNLLNSAFTDNNNLKLKKRK